MGFLFGDSTPTAFEENFLEVVRDAVDVLAAIAEADERIVTADDRKNHFRAAADAEAARLEKLTRALLSAVAMADKGGDASPTSVLANELVATVSERHGAAAAAVTAKLGEDMRAVDAAVAFSRSRYRQALETYLLLRSPPDARTLLSIALVSGGKEHDHYVAGLAGESDFGLAWSIEIAIPSGGFWSEPLRIDRLIEDGLSVKAPQLTGLIKKEVKVKKQKLDRLFVTQLTDDRRVVKIALRPELDADTGYDFSADLHAGTITAVRIGPESDAANGPFEVDDVDRDALLALAARLRQTVSSLPKKRLVQATFDGAPFDGTNAEAQPHLVEIVPRLVAKLAPFVAQIAARSKADDELILRRSLADGHREEIFLPKSALREKIDHLDEAHRGLFTPLSLGPSHGHAFEPNEPPTFPTVRSELPRTISSRPHLAAEPAVEAVVEAVMDAVVSAVVEPMVEAVADVVAPPREAQSEPPPVPPPPDLYEPVPPPAPPPPRSTVPRPDAPPISRLSRELEAVPSSRNDALVSSLKEIRALAREGKMDEGYRKYASLFASPEFGAARPEDRRQALKLLLLAKAPATTSEDLKEAHRAAIGPLQALVLSDREPADYEMLGIAYVVLDEPAKATEIFKKALDIERARNPASDLCGNLMRRVSQL